MMVKRGCDGADGVDRIDGAEVDTGAEGMAKTPLSRIHRLSALVGAQLQQFESDEEGGEEGAASVSRPEVKRKKNPFIRAGMAGGAVASAAAIAGNKEKIKAGVQSGKAAATEAGRTAAFKGMRATAGVMNKGAKVAEKVSGATFAPAAQKAADTLRKGAKKLRKGSMKFFDQGTLAQIVRIEGKIREFEKRGRG